MWFLIRQVEDFGYLKNPIYGTSKMEVAGGGRNTSSISCGKINCSHHFELFLVDGTWGKPLWLWKRSGDVTHWTLHGRGVMMQTFWKKNCGESLNSMRILCRIL